MKMEGCRLSLEEKGVIVGMSHLRMSQYCIVGKLGIPPSTVKYALKRFQKYGTMVTSKALRQCYKLIE